MSDRPTDEPPEDWGPGSLGQQMYERGAGNAGFSLFIGIAVFAVVLVLAGRL